MLGLVDESGDSGLDPFIDAYEEAQARHGHADLDAYLPPPDHPLYAAVLCELVRVDLEYGWTRGRPRRLDDYLARFPALRRDPKLLSQAAFEECRLRRQAGEAPTPDEYRRLGIEDLGWLLPPPPPPPPRAGRETWNSELTPISPGPSHRDEPTVLDDDSPRLGDPDKSAGLLETLREADPPTAERVADALRSLPDPGADFAGFRLIRELGRGGFGRVYLARQGDLADRPVALKVSADLLGEPQALAQLQHTNVVPIYSAHRVGPLRAVCMPYFGAKTLVDVLRDLQARGAPPASGAALVEVLKPRGAGWSIETAALQTLKHLSYVQAVLWIGARLADGLAHAHERGIVHRDLKPANVLLTDEGQPMLLDFNLAADTKRPGAAAAALAGGTLPYMAPEALEALRRGPIPADPRADLYALGLILFELMTGRHPFPIRRGSISQVLPLMAGDRLGPPPCAREGNPSVTPATEAILLRCLDPDPARRYQEARHLLDDLQRQLDDRPLRYVPEPSWRERAGKWARRHPRLSSGTALGLVAAVMIAGLVALYTDRQRRFGPVEAALAFRQLAEAHETARVLLLDPAADAARREEGIAACRAALERYGVAQSLDWSRSPLARDLPEGSRAELRGYLGELLLLWAAGLSRGEAGLEPGRRAALAHDALRWNALAETFYAAGEAPRVLWAQRARLAELAGDAEAAGRARSQAEAIPVRSIRDYALLFLDDPGRAAPMGVLPALAEASRRNPQDFALWMNLGHCHTLLGRLAEAEDCFSVAIVLRPESPWTYFHRGRVELERKRHDQAILDFDRALRIRPGLAGVYVDRALARIGLRDDAGAIKDLDAALEAGARPTRIYFLRAEVRARSGDREGAARDRAEGLHRTPDDPESWVARALARLPDDPSGALADLDEALRLDPRSRPALQSKAAVLSDRLGRVAEAVAVLDRAVALYPEFVPARVGRGVLLARLGRRRDAHCDAEEARRRDDSGDTTYRVACIYALTSKTEPSDRPRALRMLATALGQGSAWVDIARTDPDLDPLRERDDFRNLLRTFSDPSATDSSERGPARGPLRDRRGAEMADEAGVAKI